MSFTWAILWSEDERCGLCIDVGVCVISRRQAVFQDVLHLYHLCKSSRESGWLCLVSLWLNVRLCFRSRWAEKHTNTVTAHTSAHTGRKNVVKSGWRRGRRVSEWPSGAKHRPLLVFMAGSFTGNTAICVWYLKFYLIKLRQLHFTNIKQCRPS